MLKRDFHTSIDLAASQLNDAICTVRVAGLDRLPIPHRILIKSLGRKLDAAMDDLAQLKEDPWQQEPSKPRQLHLL
jgi:hypothetical protein